MKSRCGECNQWVEGSQWHSHRCVKAIAKNLFEWRVSTLFFLNFLSIINFFLYEEGM